MQTCEISFIILLPSIWVQWSGGGQLVTGE